MERDLCDCTLLEAAAQLRRRETSSVELTRAVLARIERLDSALHSYLTVLSEPALHAAATADRERAAGTDRGPLHGIPVAVKDLYYTKGVRTTCASRVLAEWTPDFDATAVERLAAAGAVLVGKLNMTEFAMSGYAPGLPIPCNPWDLQRHAGGSSSGSGVATAAGLCFAALGTDTGGSIRNPSAWCGVVGVKPSYGRVSRYGVFPLGMTLDHVGPMTRGVADAAVVLEAIAGPDPRDPTSLPLPVPACRAALGRGAHGLRVGVDEHFVRDYAHPDVIAALGEALHVLRGLGAEIIEVSMPAVDDALFAWPVICAAEALVGHAATFPSRAADYGPSFRSFLEYGASLRAEDYARAHVARVEFTQRLRGIFEGIDLFACPSAFMQPPPADAMDPYGPFSVAVMPFLRFTAPFNLSGNPTLSLPAGFGVDGMPHSLQLVGRHLEEAVLCQLGHAYEQATEWHARRPALCGAGAQRG